MKITFVSNYINHHQIPFSLALMKYCKDYCFVQTEPMEQERASMGWGVDLKEYPFVHLLYEEEDFCRDRIANSDVVIFGWTNKPELEKARLDDKKLTFRMSERIYREGQWKALSPRGLVAKYREHVRYKNAPVYLLCAGAYVASDFHLIGAYPDKMYEFGYFTTFREYDNPEQKWEEKGETLQLLWAGRFMPLKHAEYAIMLSKKLTEQGIDHKLHMIGSGECEANLLALADGDLHIQFYGFMEPTKVRDMMERCHIHLFTSNHLEGWGAVVNEALNSVCVEAASRMAGAVPTLIADGQNGISYDGSYDDLERKVLTIVSDREQMKKMALKGYATIEQLWNADVAAQRFMSMATKLLEGGGPAIYENGPLSPAKIRKPLVEK